MLINREDNIPPEMNIDISGTNRFQISLINNYYGLTVEGKWNGNNNDGHNHHTITPQYQITLLKTTTLYIHYSNLLSNNAVLLNIYNHNGRIIDYDDELKDEDKIENSNMYNFYSYDVTKSNLRPGNYVIELLIYNKTYEGKYTLLIESETSFIINRIKELGEFQNHYKYDGGWYKRDGTAAGCLNHKHYFNNPMYLLIKLSKYYLLEFLLKLSMIILKFNVF